MARKQAEKRAIDASTFFRDRVIGFERLETSELMDHQKNWRVHPQHQQRIMTAVLENVGIVGALLIYSSDRQGGKTILDGHMRRDISQDGQTWPCLITDLTDEEADLVLMVYDPITHMIEVETEQYRVLYEGRDTALLDQEEGLKGFLDEEARAYGLLMQSFAPGTESEQGALDSLKMIECPSCGHEFAPSRK